MNRKRVFTCDNSWAMSDALSACVVQAQLLLLAPFSSTTMGKLVRQKHEIKAFSTKYVRKMDLITHDMHSFNPNKVHTCDRNITSLHAMDQ